VEEVALNQTQRTEVSEKAAGEHSDEEAISAIREHIVHVHCSPIGAFGGAAAEHHRRSFLMARRQDHHVSRVIRPIGGAEYEAVHGNPASLNLRNCDVAAVTVTARIRFADDRAVSTGDLRGPIGRIVHPDSEYEARGIKHGLQFCQHRSETRLLVMRRENHRVTL